IADAGYLHLTPQYDTNGAVYMLRRLALSALLCVNFSLLAQTPSPNPLPVSPPVKPELVAPAPDHSQEAFVVEKLRYAYRFENDGTGRREVTARIKVQSEAGVEQWGQLVVGYNSANERVEIPYVRVHKADGSTVTTPADSVQDLSIPLEREAPVYTDYRQKHITVPGLRPGEELEYNFVTVTHTPLAPGQFWMEHDFVKSGTVLDETDERNVLKEGGITLNANTEHHSEIMRSKDTWR